MTTLCLALIGLAFVIACPLTWIVRRVGERLGQMDKPGERKIHAKPIPSTGGVAIFVAIALPMLAAILAIWFAPQSIFPEAAQLYIQGARSQTPLALALLGCLAALHITGLIDDRKALGPWSKLAVQVGAAGVPVLFFDVRLLELLGPVASIAVTVFWFAAITNSFNFLDNMDGLSGGVACICASLFFIVAVAAEQWFVAGTLALLMGALLGFLVFNFPPAKIFMGDCGSLVVGYLLAFCSVRMTYFGPETGIHADHWWSLLTPLFVLAIPLYDLTSVTVLRLSQGRSPLVGDTQHFSHRLVRKGLSRRAAVGVIWACTLAAGLGGVILAWVDFLQAVVIAVQTAMILLVLLLLEAKVRNQHD